MGEKRWEHRGEIVTGPMLSRANKRICPLCIADDLERAGGEPHAAHHAYGRSEGMLGPLRACRRHGVSLVAVATGSTPSEAHDFAAAVMPLAGDVAALRRMAEPVGPSSMEDYLRDRLAGRRGAGFLDGLAWHAAADACQTIGAVATFGPDAGVEALGEGDRRAAGVAGFAIASRGVEGIRAFLSKLDRDYDGSRFSTDGPQARYGSLHRRLASALGESDLDPLRAVVSGHIVATTPVGPGDAVFGEPVQRRVVHSIRSASLEYGIHPKRLRKILQAKGVLGEADEGKTDERAVFPAQINEGVLKNAAGSLSLTEVETYLNAGRVQARLLMEGGFIRPFVEVKALKASEKNFAKADLDAFLDKLLAGTVIVRKAPEGSHDIRRAAKRANCGAGEIVRLILDGKLRWVGRLSGIQGYISVLVDLDEVKGHVHGEARCGLTAVEVEKRLRTCTKTVKVLIANGVLPSSTIVNPTNRCPTRVVAVEDVAHFETTYVSLNILAEERGVHFMRLQKMLVAAGISPALGRDVYHATFYRRADATGV